MAVTDQKLVHIFEQGRRLLYERDDIIIRARDIPSGVYYIVSGAVKIYSLCKDGEPNIMMTLRSGEVFPIYWAVSDSTRDLGCAALDTTEVLRISRGRFLEAVRSEGLTSQAILEMLTGHFFALVNEIDNLGYRSARERVAFRLLFLASEFGHIEDNEAIIYFPVTNAYIARSAHITRETASRELSRLQRKHLIRYAEGRLIIPDVLHLQYEISHQFNINTLSLD